MIRHIIIISLILKMTLLSTISLVGQTGQDSISDQETRKKEFNISSLELIDYPLPNDVKKLKPKQNEFKIQIGIQRLQYNIWKNRYNLNPSYISSQLEQTHRYYFDKPKFLQFNIAYQIKPWIKAGILTHRRKNLADGSSYRGNNLSAYLDLEIDFKRTWGAFVEFSPLPVRYMRLRRREFYLGASINKESITIWQPINGSYLPDMMNWRKFGEEKEQIFSLLSSQFYGGVRIYLFPFLSMHAKVGYYYIPPLKLDGYIINLPDPLQDLDIDPEPFNFSWHFYSLGLNFHL